MAGIKFSRLSSNSKMISSVPDSHYDSELTGELFLIAQFYCPQRMILLFMNRADSSRPSTAEERASVGRNRLEH
jgi:hypothetical protein